MIAWIQANAVAIMLLSGLFGAVLDTVGHALPAGMAQRLCLGFARLAPGNFVGSFKALTGQVAAPLSRSVPPIAIGALLILSCQGLTPAQVAEQQAEVVQYEAQQLACIDQAATRAQADACRDGVRVKWCGTGGALADAGACSYTSIFAALDAGAQ